MAGCAPTTGLGCGLGSGSGVGLGLGVAQHRSHLVGRVPPDAGGVTQDGHALPDEVDAELLEVVGLGLNCLYRLGLGFGLGLP